MESLFRKVFIIAEAGVNHNGSFERAKQLVDVAKEAGADAVKFQLFKSEELVVKGAPKAEYQKSTGRPDDDQLMMLKSLELSFEEHMQLAKYCKDKGILYMTTAFDLESLGELRRLNVRIIKVPSGEITNLPYLRVLARLPHEKVIVSTGASDFFEVEQALKVLLEEGLKKENIIVLHCNTQYPSPLEDVNLNAMLAMQSKLKVAIGYSDHTMGVTVPIAAVAMGAVCIEKHFTLDKNLPGPDHKASLSPNELCLMVKSIREVEIALGDSEKKPRPSEISNRTIVRKSIVAKQKIQKGEVFSETNLTTKRPATGVSPMKWDEIIGQRASQNYEEDDFIEES